MLATYPQYSPQALLTTPFGATLFAPPGLQTGNSLFGHEPGFAGFVQPGFVQPGFVQPTFVQPGSPFTPAYGMTAGYISPQTPYTPYAVAQQLVLALAQLAQQISVHSVVSQQIGAVLQQLTQQVQAQSLPGMAGFGIAQPYAPFIGATPGVQPAWQAWGGPRAQTIQ